MPVKRLLNLIRTLLKCYLWLCAEQSWTCFARCESSDRTHFDCWPNRPIALEELSQDFQRVMTARRTHCERLSTQACLHALLCKMGAHTPHVCCFTLFMQSLYRAQRLIACLRPSQRGGRWSTFSPPWVGGARGRGSGCRPGHSPAGWASSGWAAAGAEQVPAAPPRPLYPRTTSTTPGRPPGTRQGLYSRRSSGHSRQAR